MQVVDAGFFKFCVEEKNGVWYIVNIPRNIRKNMSKANTKKFAELKAQCILDEFHFQFYMRPLCCGMRT